MPNAIKYNVSAETLALNKGNFWIGNGSVGKGPTSSTGYYNGITPPSGGYTIYLNKENNGPSIYVASNDTQLISLTNQIAGTSYTGVNQCFTYYYSQTDKVCVSQDYPSDFPYIVLDGLVLYLDAGITLSYPGNGTTWTDVNGLGPKNNGTLTNGPTYSGGTIILDGIDDYISGSNLSTILNGATTFTFSVWIYPTNLNNSGTGGIGYRTVVDTPGRQLSLWIGTKGQGQYYGLGGSSSNYLTNFNWENNKWQMITMIANTSNSQIIKNNNIISQTISNGGSFNQQLTFGNNPSSGGSFMQGNYGLIQMYNRVLSSSEIEQNYNATKSKYGL
jgi:hypothetical protein